MELSESLSHSLTERQANVYSYLKGDIYEALMIAECTEVSVHKFYRYVKDQFNERSKIEFLKRLELVCKKLLEVYRSNTPQYWEMIDKSYPDFKKFKTWKLAVKNFWSKREEFCW